MKKKRRVPDVLWRLYRNRACTLADTIVSLLPLPPPSPADCWCKGCGCLGCSGDGAMSFLLRSDDPPDYHKLLNRCFVVMPDDQLQRRRAFYPECRWSQLTMVRRTIEMIMCESRQPSNLICSGYNKLSRASSVLDLLTTSPWCLLLERIGDDTMFHLLKYASIFLLHSRANYHRVAGPLVIDLVPKVQKHTSGSHKKRKRVNGEDKCTSDNINCLEQSIESNGELQLCGKNTTTKTEKCLRPLNWQHRTEKFNMVEDEDKDISDTVNSLQKSNSSLTVNCCIGSGTCSIGCNHINCFKSFGWRCWRKQSPSPEAYMMNYTALEDDVVKSNEEFKESSKNTAIMKRKHSRPFSWQRRRKRRQLTSREDNMLPSEASSHYEKDYGILLQSFSTSLSKETEKVVLSQEPEDQNVLQITSKCFSCLMSQARRENPKVAKVNKQLMFYKSGCSFSFLPRNHILNTLKPNDAGAVVLMMNIFGLSERNSQSISGLQGIGRCLVGSACLYHSFLGLLKSLIRKARCCNYLKLLDKHCPVPCSDGNVGSFEGYKLQTNLLDKRHMGFQSKWCLLEEPDCHVNEQQENLLNKTPGVLDYQVEKNGNHCPKRQVVSFIWAVCRNIVPPDLLGAPSNLRALRRNISKFISLRRYECFCLRQCMHGLKTSSFSFLCEKFLCCFSNHIVKDDLGRGANICTGSNGVNNANGILKNKVFESWIYWFFNCLVVPIVYANFYVTESEQGRQDIFYYRKPVWEEVTHTAIALLEKQSYRLLDDASFRNILSKRAFGFSKVRFCPKEHGVRILANLRAPSKVPIHLSLKSQSRGIQEKVNFHSKLVKCHSKPVKCVHFKSVNNVLRDLHVVLKGIKVKCPEKLGSSVFDYTGVYRKLCPFLVGLKNGSGSLPRLLVVICDVSKAFDSVDQDKLLTVMKDVIFSDEYLVDEYSQVFCAKKSLRFCSNQILSDQNISNGVSNVTATSFSSNALHSVIFNQVSSRYIRKEELYRNLEEHVKRNVLQIHKKFYLQEIGISQGSILSSLLCSYYYGDMEKNVLFPFLDKIHDPHIFGANGNLPIECNAENGSSSVQDGIISQSPKHILIRFIDDFLFISTSKKKAAGFFSRLKRGFREYNCSMNGKKFCMNFDADQISRFSSNRVYIGEDGISFLPWSGMLINSCTMEIQADYTRYLNVHLGSTLTVCWQDRPGRHLKAKLCDYTRTKCHPIFFDSNINSAAVVRLNIYQTFLLCAMKFHCYVCDLSSICSLQAVYYSNIIQNSFRYMYKHIRRSMRAISVGSNFCPILHLEKEEVDWLGLHAYIRVLKKKQSRHRELLLLLRSKLTDVIKDRPSAQLIYAIDDSHSSVFWKIRY